MSHFYLHDGSPFYEVPYADPRKGLRPATLRDARKVNALPSVTTVLDIVRKPGLENWKAEQHILAALTNPDIRPEMPLKEIMRIIKRDAKRQAEEAAEEGSRIHDAIESGIKGRPFPPQYNELVINAIGTLTDYCGSQAWTAEERFANTVMGYGGMIDLHSPEWLVDTKTRPGDPADQRLYPEYIMQLVAYETGISATNDPVRRLGTLIVSRDDPESEHHGKSHFHEWPQQEAAAAWPRFMARLNCWQVEANYFPHLEEEKAA